MIVADPWRVVICCASGESFTTDQAAAVMAARRADLCRVVVVNDNYRRVPNADVLYACDGAWWNMHVARVRSQFNGELLTQDHAAAAAHGLNWVEYVLGDDMLPREDPRIGCGRNGGLQGMMVARQRGARRLILVGYDMDGPSHWFGKHPLPLANGNAASFVKHFDRVAEPLREEGTAVFNCSPTTTLQCFRKATLAECIDELKRERETLANDR